DKTLRQSMGETGKQRARSVYDWKHIIAAYQELWQHLALLRKEANEVAIRQPGQPSNPLRDDPFQLFSTYPTEPLSPAHHLTLLQPEPEAYYRQLYSLAMHRFGYLPPGALCLSVIQVIKHHPDITLTKLLPHFSPQVQSIVTR